LGAHVVCELAQLAVALLRVVERLAWIAVGGLAVIAAMVGFALKLVGT